MFFTDVFHFLVIFFANDRNVKRDVFTFKTKQEKCGNKSLTRLFTLSKQTFSSQHVTFLKQAIICCFMDAKNKETIIKYSSGSRLS